MHHQQVTGMEYLSDQRLVLKTVILLRIPMTVLELSTTKDRTTDLMMVPMLGKVILFHWVLRWATSTVHQIGSVTVSATEVYWAGSTVTGTDPWMVSHSE